MLHPSLRPRTTNPAGTTEPPDHVFFYQAIQNLGAAAVSVLSRTLLRISAQEAELGGIRAAKEIGPTHA